MATADGKILIQVEADTSKMASELSYAIQTVESMKEQQKRLRKEIAAGNDENGEYARQLVDVTTKPQNAQRQVKSQTAVLQAARQAGLEQNASLDQQRQYLNVLQKAYANLSGAEKEAADATGGLRDQIKDLRDAIYEQEHEIGIDTRNVGNYAESINGYQKSIDGLAGSQSKLIGTLQKVDKMVPKSAEEFKAAGTAVKGFGKQLLAMLANPIVLGIAALVLSVEQLVEAFKRNEDAMTGLDKAAAPFKAIMQAIQRLFDDIVKTIVDVSESMEDITGDFSLLEKATEPVQRRIAIIRAQFAIFSTLLKDVGQGVKYLKDTITDATKDNPLVRFINDMQAKVREAFATVTGYIEKAANSDLGKMLGLDELYGQLKEIMGAGDELTAKNRKIAKAENELNKKRREYLEKNAEAELKAAELREKTEDKNRYSVEERAKMMRQAGKIEQQIADRNYDLAKREYELVKLKNSLTKSGTEDLQAEAEAYAAMVRAQTAAYDKQREYTKKLTTLDREKRAEDMAAWELEEELMRAREEGLAFLNSQLDNAQEKAQAALEAQKEAMAELDAIIAANEEEEEIDDEEVLSVDEMCRKNFGLDSEGVEYFQKLLKEGIGAADAATKALEEQGKRRVMNFSKAMGNMANAFSSCASAVGEYAEENKRAAQAQKALTMMSIIASEAEAIAQGALAIAEGIEQSQKVAFPANLVALASTVAAVGAVVGTTISNFTQAKQVFSSAGSFENGGIVPGTSYTGDRLTANVNSREMVLTQGQQAHLFDMINVGQSGYPMEGMRLAIMEGMAAAPAPVMVYEEFETFTGRTATYNEIASV